MTELPTDGAPLAGLRVVEVSSFVAAPLCGMTLAQLGAEVIRVDPLGGASDRGRWPVTASGTSLYWAGLNKGKQSVTVDLRSPEGQDLVAELVTGPGDGGGILVTNAVGRDWLDYEALRRRRGDLIHLTVQGHADGTPAVDYTVNAAMGFPMVTGPEGHADPVNHVLPAWDIACGLYAALGIVSADRLRRETGKGQEITIALYDVALATAGNLGFVAEAEVNSTTRGRIGNHLYGGFARDFLCRDQHRVMVVALAARHWQALLGATGMGGAVGALESALGCDFTLEEDRYSYREVLAALFQRWFAERDYEQVVTALAPTPLLWSRYRSFTELVRDQLDEVEANRIMSRIDQPGVGQHLAPASPLVTSHSLPPEPAPRLGEDTDAVLARLLGLEGGVIAQLRADRVVGEPC